MILMMNFILEKITKNYNTPPTGLNRLDFKHVASNGSIFDGNIKEVKVFNKALTDTELQQLTTQ